MHRLLIIVLTGDIATLVGDRDTALSIGPPTIPRPNRAWPGTCFFSLALLAAL